MYSSKMKEIFFLSFLYVLIYSVFVQSFNPKITVQSPKEEKENNENDMVDFVERQDNQQQYLNGKQFYSSVETIENQGDFGVEYTGHIENATKYIWKFNYTQEIVNEEERNSLHRLLFLKVFAEVDGNCRKAFPVEFEVRHFHKINQWTLPNKLKSRRFYRSFNKTLCFQQTYDDDEDAHEGDHLPEESKFIYLTVTTSSRVRTSFKLIVNLESNNFISEFNEPRRVSVSLSSQVHFRVTAPNAVTSRYALLLINSPVSEGCLSVTLQSPMCPIGEDETDIRLKGIHQTMSKLAAITIKMEDLRKGRFLSLIMHENDTECDSINPNLKNWLNVSNSEETFPSVAIHQSKNGTDYSNDSTKKFKIIEIVLQEKISDDVYLLSTVGILMFLTAFCIMFGILYWKCFRVKLFATDLKDGQVEHGPSSHTSGNLNGGHSHSHDKQEMAYSHCCFFFLVPEKRKSCEPSRLHESCKKCSKDIAKSAQRYVGTFSVVAAFYVLPVYQFVHFYQLVVNKPGNEDLCYYNYLCLHPLGEYKDFNHIFSNAAYVMLGLLFLVLVYLEDSARRPKTFKGKHHINHEFGIHSHFGISYAMGAALVMEGVLSGMYHVCPNHMSFMFDMSFMYVIAVLCMIKLYQARRPDTNASASLAFGSLAILILIGVASTVIPSSYVWIMTTVVHLSVVFLLTVHLYSWGTWKFDWKVSRNATELKYRIFSFLHPFTNQFEWMTMFLVGSNFANWILAGLGFLLFFKFGDVSSHLLFVVLVNLGLYSVIYLVYKMKHSEKILLPTKLYLFVSAPIWAIAVYTFIAWSSNWQLSPAESRKLNADCVVMKFYDLHDVWHFLSAFGMFFMFMFFFTLDDDLKLVKQSEICVF